MSGKHEAAGLPNSKDRCTGAATSTARSERRRLVKVDKIVSTRKQPSAVSLSSLLAVARVLRRETGMFTGWRILIKSILWDSLFNRPQWHPELFDFKDEREERSCKGIFEKQLMYTVLIFENLKKRYGEFIADKITSEMAIPTNLPFLLRSFRPGESITHIDQFRQVMADFIGDEEAIEYTEEVTEDGTEVQYRISKCAHIMILRAYGLLSFAGYCCLTDHVLADNFYPELVFGRTHAIGTGDSYCNHNYRIREHHNTRKSEKEYGDCFKVRFGGRDTVRYWEEVIRNRGGKYH
jgi:hypothetical protein